MNSFFANLFLQIQNQIQTQVPEIRFVEQNFGQYAFDDTRATLAYPALLIDFTNTNYSALQGNNQLGQATINLVLLFAPYSQSYNLAPELIKLQALNYYEIEHKLVHVLQNWQPDFCTPLTRTDAKSQNRNEIGLRIRELNFTTEFEDYADDNTTEVEVAFSFNGSIGA
ncbi:MAG: hypothetical protein K2Q03_06035 [Sphingobacteriaceae bacterium]|nr:hypothetical protein [Sphingobacteriaceae bacterium]